ncbi:energy transducer TonB [Hymenobacter latericus]|uniref:energy transducer TonB n=1 Tax=Hymenobacter sp. YIM 151858-1 TaxID=2987688 RepID=UPI002226A1A0|nr:energy transducer TonB [Hymenobacter sp. YIM 151858-1]UYZ60026.1 energy transducer TonB [Hymenobacter sp. YIM 151858-1]
MKLLIGAAGLWLSTGLAAHAQQPALERIFYLNYWQQEAPASADMASRVVRYRTAAGAQLDSVFHYNSGKLQRTVLTTVLPTGDTAAVIDQWRANGHRYLHFEHLNQKGHGENRQYNLAGQLTRRTTFERGQKLAETCYDAAGAAVPCQGDGYSARMPEYPGGTDAMFRLLARNIKYPKDALKRRTQGKVLVAFVVDAEGQVRDVHVTQGLMPSLDAEAVRVLQLLERWQPALQMDEPVPVTYTVPVTFTIR